MSKPSKKAITLEMLTKAGDQGVTNRALNDAGIFRYSARIHELKKEGHDIRKRHVKDGLYIFTLENGAFPTDLEPGRVSPGAATPQQETEPAGDVDSASPADPLPLFDPEPVPPIRGGFGHQDLDQRAA